MSSQQEPPLYWRPRPKGRFFSEGDCAIRSRGDGIESKVMLTPMALIAVLLLAGAMMMSAGRSSATEREPVITVQPDSATTSQVSEGVQFLRTLHELILNPPMTPEKITAAFGWPVLKQSVDALGRRHTDFNLYVKPPWGTNPMLTEGDGKTRIYIPLTYSTFCIPSEEVIAEFGSQFKPMIVLIDGPPEKRIHSEIVERNLKLFIYGPRYEISSPVKIVIGFKYLYSECLESISIGHPSY